MKLDTKIVRSSSIPDPTTGSVVPPIHQTATYVLEEVGKDKGFDYTRASNPTRALLEKHLADIEGAKYGICFSSGMSAVDSVLKLLKSGDHVVCSDDVYGGVSRHFNQVLVHYGIEFTYVNSSNPLEVEQAIKSNTKLLWIETPTNPLLKITDLHAMNKIAKNNNLLFGVDSTFSTPVFLRPLEFGADIAMHSTTKYLSGHNQIIGGAILTNNQDIFDKMKFIQKTIGAVSSPFDCYLTMLGLRTLHLRMERHAENAQAVAEFLDSHPKVSRVAYPGLPSDSGHEIAKQQMLGFSGMISFELVGGIPAGKHVMNNVKLCFLAESLGAVETMITHPATMTHAEVPEKERHARGLTDGLVRLSVGIEHKKDIIDDLEQALEGA
ncbi:MAG: cystathionine gamma-synthase [Candidatus Marinimicrobia bacterium]|nr:cystathionine gamma-synthase [Candidatus Neomarinimicrobiota bacterium]